MSAPKKSVQCPHCAASFGSFSEMYKVHKCDKAKSPRTSNPPASATPPPHRNRTPSPTNVEKKKAAASCPHCEEEFESFSIMFKTHGTCAKAPKPVKSEHAKALEENAKSVILKILPLPVLLFLHQLHLLLLFQHQSFLPVFLLLLLLVLRISPLCVLLFLPCLIQKVLGIS